MEEQKKKRNIWGILGIAAGVIVGVVVIFALVTGNGGSAPEGPEIEVPLPSEPGLPSATAQVAVNVRSGPGTNYPSFGVAPQGTVGEVIGVSGNRQWWVVKLPASIDPSGQGWVAAQYVQVQNADNVPVIPDPALPPEIEVPLPPQDGPTATALDVINVRSGPGTQYPAYGIAQKGAQGEVIGVSEDGKWWVVKMPTTMVSSGQGWVSADWVKTSNTENVPVIPAP